MKSSVQAAINKQAQYAVLRTYGFEKTAASLLTTTLGGSAAGALLGGAGGYLTGEEGHRGENASKWALRGGVGGAALGAGAGLLLRRRGSAPLSPEDVQGYQADFEALRSRDHAGERAARQAKLERAFRNEAVQAIQQEGLDLLTQLHRTAGR